MQDILLGKVKYDFDEKKLEDELEKELAEMSYHQDEDTLNQSQVSMRDFAQKKMEQWQKEQKEDQQTDNAIMDQYRLTCQDRDKMFEEIEGEIKKMKQLTAYVNNDEEIEISDDETDQKVKFKSQAINSEQLQMIKQKVKQQFEDTQQINQIVFAEEVLEQKLKNKALANLDNEDENDDFLKEIEDQEEEQEEGNRNANNNRMENSLSSISVRSSCSQQQQKRDQDKQQALNINSTNNTLQNKLQQQQQQQNEKPQKAQQQQESGKPIIIQNQNEGKQPIQVISNTQQPQQDKKKENQINNNNNDSQQQQQQQQKLKVNNNQNSSGQKQLQKGPSHQQQQQQMQQSQQFNSSKIHQLGKSSYINTGSEALELRKEKMQQERDQMNMEQEDLLSLEFEEFNHKQQFNDKDKTLPTKFDCLRVYQFQQQKSTRPAQFFVHPTPGLIEKMQILAPTEENLAAKNSPEVCMENLKNLKVRSKQSLSSLFKIEKINNSQQQQQQSSKREILKPINVVSTQNQQGLQTNNNNLIIVINEKNNISNSNKTKTGGKAENNEQQEEDLSLMQCNSIMPIYFKKVSAMLNERLQSILKAGIPQKLKQLSESYQPRLLNIFQDDENNVFPALLDFNNDDINIEENKLNNNINEENNPQKSEKQQQQKQLQSKTSGKTKSLSLFLDAQQKQREFFDQQEDESKYTQQKQGKNNNNNIKNQTQKNQQKQEKNIWAKTTRLELKVEELSDLRGLEKLQNLHVLQVSVNRLAAILEISACKQLLEVNLAQNLIVDYSPLSVLEELRLLNLELNLIVRMQPLTKCQQLEILNLSNNQIQKIEGLECNPRLKRLTLFRNKVSHISNGFEKNYCLEDLDLGSNALEDMTGLEQCCLLRRLVLSHNQIAVVPQRFNDSLFLLTELRLNGNCLTDISPLRFLPSLQHLDLQDNQIERGPDDTQVLALPSLRTLSISYNRVQSFADVFNMLRFSPHIRALSYTQNEFLQGVSVDLQELYEFLFLSRLRSLQEVNAKKLDIGHVKYLEMKFSNVLYRAGENENYYHYYLQQNSSKSSKMVLLQNSSNNNLQIKKREFDGFLNRFSMISREYQFTQGLESRRTQLTKISAFVKTVEYISQRGRAGQQHLFRLLSDNNNSRFDQPCSYFGANNNVFYLRDFYDNKYGRALRKIASFFCQAKYRRRKRLRYFLKNIKKIVKIQAHFRRCVTQRRIPDLKQRLERARMKCRGPFAVKIQKVFRGFMLRKRKAQLFNKINYDVGELEEFDDAWLKNEPDFDTNLKIPDNFNIEDFIMTPQQQQQQQQMLFLNSQNKQQQQKQQGGKNRGQPTRQRQSIGEEGQDEEEDKEQQQHEVQSNAGDYQQQQQLDAFQQSSLSYKSLQSTNNAANKLPQYQQQQNKGNNDNKKINQNDMQKVKVTDDEKKQLMVEWGFEKPEVAQALAYKMEKDRKRNNMKKKHELSAMEKYQQFLKNSKLNK